MLRIGSLPTAGRRCAALEVDVASDSNTLTAVLRKHQGPFFHGTHTRCGCRRIVQTADEWARHVAEEIKAAGGVS